MARSRSPIISFYRTLRTQSGIVGNVLCSEGGGPSFGGNQRQNKQANDAKNQAERQTWKKFTPALERMFHDEITGMNYSYQDLVRIAVEILEMHG